jgi:hypothetical protein
MQLSTRPSRTAKALRTGARARCARRCAATGEICAPERLIRFVLDPNDVATPDFSGRLPGRGAWVKADREALAAAVNKKAFARSFGRDVKTLDDLADRVEAGLAAASLSALGLARRVGDAAVGFEQAARLCRTGKAAALVSAADARGRQKLKGLAPEIAFFGFLDGAELSKALGRDGVAYVALKQGAAAERFMREARRLKGFRAHGDPPQAHKAFE